VIFKLHPIQTYLNFHLLLIITAHIKIKIAVQLILPCLPFTLPLGSLYSLGMVNAALVGSLICKIALQILFDRPIPNILLEEWILLFDLQNKSVG